MTARERQRRRRLRRKDPVRFLLVMCGALFGVLVVILVAGVTYVSAIAQKVPPLSQLQVTTYGLPSTVYAADGSVLGQLKATIIRQPIRASHMPKALRDATVAIEDHGFYQHGAVDYFALIRAALTDVTSGKTLQGGSTITMQLVRNLFPAVGDSRTFSRKIKEAVVAQRFEAHHSKLWILTDYLNTIPYGTVGGQTAEGVEAASRIFFNHPASHDTLAQAALLAGLPQAPTSYNPFTHPQAAIARRNQVLAAMVQYAYITPAAAAAAEAEPLGVVPNSYYKDFHDNYFIDFIRQQLLAKYGPDVLAAGDLKIYTTINPHLGALARQAIKSVLNLPTDPAASLVSEDPANGYVDTMAMSTDYSKSQYNLATTAQRQPGSTFKAIVLATALARGIDPYTTSYFSHTLPAGWISAAPTYTVMIDGGYSLNAALNLDQALVASDNTVFAQLAADLGEQNVTQMAYALGVTTHLNSYPAEALGGLTYGVTPLEMANVYSTIADGGWRNKQITIKRVVFPSGRVDRSWGIPHRVKVLSTAAATVETQILHDNVLGGTATGSAISCPSAAKTGTTSKLVDAWLDGFTPGRTTIVWMGYPQANISMNSVHGQPQFGGLLPAQIWQRFMSQVITPPCVPLADPAANPMTYVPFSGIYQQKGFLAEVATGPTGATGATGKRRNTTGGASVPPILPARHHHSKPAVTTTTPATTTTTTSSTATTTTAPATPPATTTPTTTTPPSTGTGGGAAAPATPTR